MPPTRRPISPPLIVAALLAVTAIAYIPAMRAGEIWDDSTYVFNNPTLETAGGLRQIWLEPAASPAYYPLVFSGYWLERRIFGTDPTGYHVVNVLLHLLNVALAFVLLRRLQVRGAWLGAALFALHPVHVESVAWITERKDVLSGAFLLAALLAWLRFIETREPRHYVAVLLLHAGAMLSKSVAASFPLAALLLSWWKAPRNLRRDGWLVLPLVAISIVLSALTAWRERLDGSLDEGRTLIESLLLVGRNLAFYAGKIVAPIRLMSIYPRWELDAGQLLGYVWPVAAIAILVLCWRRRDRWGPGPLVAILFFVILHLPTLGLIDFNYMRYSYVADRYQYLACLGPLALIGALLVGLAPGGSDGRRRTHSTRAGWRVIVATALLLLLGVLTWRQGTLYRDAETLARDNLRLHPGAWGAHVTLAVTLASRGDRHRAEAKTHLAAAVELEPELAVAHYNLAVLRYQEGEIDAAIAGLEEVLRIDPSYPDARFSLAAALDRQGKTDAAIAEWRQALYDETDRRLTRAGSDTAKIRLALANALYLDDRLEEAGREYRRFLAEHPDHAQQGYVLLSLLLTEAKRHGKQRALELVEEDATDNTWCATILSFYRGQRTGAELLRAAANASRGGNQGYLCEAHYYIGMDRLLAGERHAARVSLQSCVDTGMTTYLEYRRARRELQALGGD